MEFDSIVHYIPVILLSMILLLFILIAFTVIHARSIVKQRQLNKQIHNNEIETPSNNQNDIESDSDVEEDNQNYQDELDDKYSFISEEYKDKNFHKSLIEARRDSSSASSTPSSVRDKVHKYIFLQLDKEPSNQGL